MAYSSSDLTNLSQGAHTADVVSLEDGATGTVLGDADSAFDALTKTTLAAWVRAFGSPEQEAPAGDALARILAAVRTVARRILDEVASRSSTALEGALGRALTMGVAQGTAFVQAASGRSVIAPAVPRVGRLLRSEAQRVGDMVRERRDRALFLLHPDRMTRWTHLLAGVGAARAALPAVRSHIAWVVATAVREGLDAVARAATPLRLWVSEADACTRCLAYTGRRVPVGEPFPGGLSWDPRQRRLGAPAVDGPPLHGNCRCRAVPWDDAWAADGVAFPVALQREAHRSIAYGRARPSESRAARLRAVRELLRTEPDLLPAVEARARTALRTGQFTTAA